MTKRLTNYTPDTAAEVQAEQLVVPNFSALSQKEHAAFNASISAAEVYALGPDLLPQEGVPRGMVSKEH